LGHAKNDHRKWGGKKDILGRTNGPQKNAKRRGKKKDKKFNAHLRKKEKKNIS